MDRKIESLTMQFGNKLFAGIRLVVLIIASSVSGCGTSHEDISLSHSDLSRADYRTCEAFRTGDRQERSRLRHELYRILKSQSCGQGAVRPWTKEQVVSVIGPSDYDSSDRRIVYFLSSESGKLSGEMLSLQFADDLLMNVGFGEVIQ